MFRKCLLVMFVSLGLVVTSAGTALAWDTIATKHGHGTVTLRAWTKNYNQVAFVADHKGTRIHVSIVIDCRDGYHFDNTWSDGGKRFRWIKYQLGNHGRCDHTFKVTGNSFPTVNLAIYARG